MGSSESTVGAAPHPPLTATVEALTTHAVPGFDLFNCKGFVMSEMGPEMALYA